MMLALKIILVLFLSFNIYTYIKRIVSPKITQKEAHLIKTETLSLRFVSLIEILTSCIMIAYVILNQLTFGGLLRVFLFLTCIKVALSCAIAFIVYKISYTPAKK